MLVMYLFMGFYYTCVRQEVDGSQDINLFLFKRTSTSGGVYKVTEDQFKKLLVVCRGLAKDYPGTLVLDEEIDFNDPLDKVIGKHDFWNLELNRDQLKQMVARYFPEEVE